MKILNIIKAIPKTIKEKTVRFVKGIMPFIQKVLTFIKRTIKKIAVFMRHNTVFMKEKNDVTFFENYTYTIKNKWYDKFLINGAFVLLFVVIAGYGFITLFKKLWYKMTHNKIIMNETTEIVFFQKFTYRVTNKRRENFIGIAFIFIWIIGYLIFTLYPVFYSLYLSFFKVRLSGRELDLQFEGINNYRAVFLSDPYFVTILGEYAVEMIINVSITIVFALVIAMLINQDIKGKGAWRTVFFLPVIITSGPVIATLINQGATTLPSIENYGFIQQILDNVGGFIANPLQALFNQILLVFWFAGIQILILLAGLQKIDRAIYEAASIDGAGPWESFWKITLPSLMPLISITIIYTVVSMSVFSLNEVIIYIQNIMLGESTSALTTGYGYSAALSWVYFVVMSLIILLFVGAISIRKKVSG